MGVGISGDNSSYTVTITGMSTSIRYHVFIADLNTDGTYGYYYCRRSSLGKSSTWTYSGKSSSPYSNYKRPVLVYTTKQSTGWNVGSRYSESAVTGTGGKWNGSRTLSYSGNIPAAKPTSRVYYLYYNANGGSGAPPTQSSVSTTNSSWTFTISSTEPTRSGYTFLGWSTSSTATSASYQPGDKIRLTSGSPKVTLYAVWEEASRVYYLYYNANGGSGAPPTQSSVSTTNSSWTFTISSTEPTRSGYTFLGWSTSSTATSASYQPGDKIRLTSGSPKVTLYAVWEEASRVYYFRNLGGLNFWVYKNGTATLLLTKNSGTLSMSVSPSDRITVASPQSGGTLGYSLWDGYKKPVYIYFDGSDSQFQDTSPTNLDNNNTVSWKGRNRRIQLRATGIKVDYYFRCMTGVNFYFVYKNGTAALQVRGTDNSVLEDVTVEDTITVGVSTTNGTPTIVHATGYGAPDYIYFDKGDGKYQSTDPTDLQDDHVVSWKGYSRYIQVKATLTNAKYRIHAFGNGGTISGAADVYRPSSSTWYTTDGLQVDLNVSEGTVRNESGDIILATPVRSGYQFVGWAQDSRNTTGVINGTIMVDASGEGTINNLYAIWKKNQISLFYWDGANSEANSNDKLLIAKGQPVGNITGGQNGNWNRLKAKIAELRKAQGGSWSYSTVPSGDPMTAAEFNDVRSGINACDGHGTLPSAVGPNSIIYAHYFQSTTANPNSLKSAINTAITTYNTT